MSVWSRVVNLLRGQALDRDIDEELESHIAEAIEQGRDPAEARRALGSKLRQREASRDVRLIGWLDSLRADAVFGWRQLMKRKVTSAAAILSLGLAIGSCTSAFRLIDALLLRPLPVADPQHLYVLTREGQCIGGNVCTTDSWAYPSFRLMRAAVKDQAELIAMSYPRQMDLTYKSDQETERAYVQYTSGWTFHSFGLQPRLGRLFTEDDDLQPGGHPVAVVTSDYWTRRFGQDPNVIGRTFRLGDDLFQIIGVVAEPFTGTSPGTVTDVFLPTMMNSAVTRDDQTWFRTLAHVKPGAAMEPIRAKLSATSRAFEGERAKGFTGMTQASIQAFLDLKLVMEPAAAGASALQQDYRMALVAMGVLVALVLLIACANVANLMTAQAAARAREMALRVSIGAGRWRLVQLVLVESAWLAFLSAALGGWFAWWSAPFVVGRINPPDNPARLTLPADWRVLAFALALTVAVTLLFGLVPAIRASTVNPASALKGGSDPHSRRRMMHALIAAQVAFCFLVLLVAGLFAATFERLSHRPTGFSTEHLLLLQTLSHRPESQVVWDQMADHLRTLPGVETVARCASPLLSGYAWNGFVSVDGAPPGPVLAYFMSISPGWMDAMKIRFIDGRDFRRTDTSPGSAIVNETFARQFLGAHPVGQSFARGPAVYQVIAVVRDAPYRNIREPILPVAFVPAYALDTKGQFLPARDVTFIVRTSNANPLALAPFLRQEISRARPDFRVSGIFTQEEMVQAQTVRERLLAMLALFFAVVALLLAGIGLYGVLDYSVIQRRREIGIRMALGARAADVARRVTAEVFAMVIAGALVGLAVGVASVRYIATLLYQVNVTDTAMLALPSFAILATTLLAALPAVIHAVRIDPVKTLRDQ